MHKALRVLMFALILFINLIFQSTWLHFFALMEVIPNTTVIIVVSYALLRGDLEGAIYGFFAGLLYDIYYGQSAGFFAAICMFIGFFCGRPFEHFFRENYILPPIACALSVLAFEFISFIFQFMLMGETDFYYYLINLMLPEAVYSALIILVVYRMMYAINSKIEIVENRKRKLF